MNLKEMRLKLAEMALNESKIAEETVLVGDLDVKGVCAQAKALGRAQAFVEAAHMILDEEKRRAAPKD